MSIMVMSEVWKKSSNDGTLLLLMLAIADYCNDEGYAWPSIHSLAKKTRKMSDRSIQIAIGKLITSGELSVERCAGVVRMPSGSKKTNLYKINLDKLGVKGIAGEVVEPSPAVESTSSPAIQCSSPAMAIASNPSLEPPYKPYTIQPQVQVGQSPSEPSAVELPKAEDSKESKDSLYKKCKPCIDALYAHKGGYPVIPRSLKALAAPIRDFGPQEVYDRLLRYLKSTKPSYASFEHFKENFGQFENRRPVMPYVNPYDLLPGEKGYVPPS